MGKLGDHEFVRMLEGLRHMMTGLEMRLLDVLTGVESYRCNTPYWDCATGVKDFLQEPDTELDEQHPKWDLRRIKRWFENNYMAHAV